MPYLEEVASEDLGFKLITSLEGIPIFDLGIDLDLFANDSLSLLLVGNVGQIFACSNGSSLILDKLSALDDSGITPARVSINNARITQLAFNADESKLLILNNHKLEYIDIPNYLASGSSDVLSFPGFFEVGEIATVLPNPVADSLLIITASKQLHTIMNSQLTLVDSDVTSANWALDGSTYYYTDSSSLDIQSPSNPISITAEILDDDILPEEYRSLYVQQLASNKWLVAYESNESELGNHEIKSYVIFKDDEISAQVTDLAPPYGSVPRVASYYSVPLVNWAPETTLHFITSSIATDLGTVLLKDNTASSIIQSEDTDRAQFPIDEDTGDDASPIGVAIDVTNVDRLVAEPCTGVEEAKGLPRLLALLHTGRLVSWWVFDKHGLQNDTVDLTRALGYYQKSDTSDSNLDQSTSLDDLSLGGSSRDATPAASKGSIFGSTPSGSLFGQTDPSKKGTSGSDNPFAKPDPFKKETNENPFGSSSKDAFQAQAVTNKESSFGSLGFGNTGSTPTASGFGSNTIGTTSGSSSGPTPGAFGSTGFGNAGGFGNTSFGNTSFGNSSFGKSSFGSSGFGSGSAKPSGFANSANKPSGFALADNKASGFGELAQGSNKESPFGSVASGSTESPFGSKPFGSTGSPFGSKPTSTATATYGATNERKPSPFGSSAKESTESKPSPFSSKPFGTGLSSEPAKPFGSSSFGSTGTSTTEPSKPSLFGSASFGSTGSSDPDKSSPFGSTSSEPSRPSAFGSKPAEKALSTPEISKESLTKPLFGAKTEPTKESPALTKPFGSTTDSAIGVKPSDSSFGSTPKSSESNDSPFGKPFGKPFGSSADSPFGSKPENTDSGSLSGPFGTKADETKKTSTKPLFGPTVVTEEKKDSPFASLQPKASTNESKPLFGAPTTSQPKTSIFDKPDNLFGKSSFGAKPAESKSDSLLGVNKPESKKDTTTFGGFHKPTEPEDEPSPEALSDSEEELEESEEVTENSDETHDGYDVISEEEPKTLTETQEQENTISDEAFVMVEAEETFPDYQERLALNAEKNAAIEVDLIQKNIPPKQPEFLQYDGLLPGKKTNPNPILDKIETIKLETDGQLEILHRNLKELEDSINYHDSSSKIDRYISPEVLKYPEHWKFSDIPDMVRMKETYETKISSLLKDAKEQDQLLQDLVQKFEESQGQRIQIEKLFSQIADYNKTQESPILKRRPLDLQNGALQTSLRTKLQRVKDLEKELVTKMMPLKARTVVDTKSITSLERVVFNLDSQLWDHLDHIDELTEKVNLLDIQETETEDIHLDHTKSKSKWTLGKSLKKSAIPKKNIAV